MSIFQPGGQATTVNLVYPRCDGVDAVDVGPGSQLRDLLHDGAALCVVEFWIGELAEKLFRVLMFGAQRSDLFVENAVQDSALRLGLVVASCLVFFVASSLLRPWEMSSSR